LLYAGDRLRDFGIEFDCVSSYTKSWGNFDAEIFVLLQDWVSADYLRGDVNPETLQCGLTHTTALTQCCFIEITDQPEDDVSAACNTRAELSGCLGCAERHDDTYE
jgi:hypothetical protein